MLRGPFRNLENASSIRKACSVGLKPKDVSRLEKCKRYLLLHCIVPETKEILYFSFAISVRPILTIIGKNAAVCSAEAVGSAKYVIILIG